MCLPTLPTTVARPAAWCASWDDDRAAFVVRDGNYVSARWPGDAHTFARRFAEVLAERCSR
jgi:putative intracellular protease/amidase